MKITPIRSLLIWTGLLFLSSSWYALLPVFRPENFTMGVILITLGTIMITIGFFQKLEKTNQNWKVKLFLLLPSLLALLLLPFPYRIGALLVSGSLLSSIILYHSSIPGGILISGLIYIFQTLLIPFFVKITPRWDSLTFLLKPLLLLIRFIGYESTVFNNLLLVGTETEIIKFSLTPEKAGSLFLMTFLIGGLVLILLSSRDSADMTRRMVAFILSLPLYALIRLLFLLLSYIEVRSLRMFWDPLWILFSMFPLAILLSNQCQLILPISLHYFFNSVETITLKKGLAIALVLILFPFLVVGSLVLEDPGVLKEGRVLIDEYHSAWESTTHKLGTEKFEGKKDVYTYYTLRKWLEHYYQVDINLDKPLDGDLLKDYDVLILKCPTLPYQPKEVEDILDFVKKGGGLLLIGDHTDLLGMNTYLNQIGNQVGLRFGSDSTFDLESGNLSSFEFSRLPLPPHPTLAKTSLFRFATSCSIRAPLRAHDVITGYSMGQEEGSLSHVYFFGDMRADTQDRYGLFLQAVTLKHGRGRIFAFSDSTVFSSFSMMMKGYHEFFLGIMDYLNRANSKVNINLTMLIPSLLLLVIGIILLKNTAKEWVILVTLVFFISGFALSLSVFAWFNQIYYHPPSPRIEYTQVAFDRQYSNFKLYHFLGNPGGEKGWEQFEGFFVGIQRLGYFPKEMEQLQDCLGSDMIIIINPDKSFQRDDITSLMRYIENGGKVLILDSIRNKHSTSNELLMSFGLHIGSLLIDFGGSAGDEVSKIPTLTVVGGNKIIFDVGKKIVNFATQPFGKGMLGIYVDSSALSQMIMGDLYSPPSEEGIKAYKLGFRLIKHLINDDSK